MTEETPKSSRRQDLGDVRRMIAFHRGLRTLEGILERVATIEGDASELQAQRDKLATEVKRLRTSRKNEEEKLRKAAEKYHQDVHEMELSLQKRLAEQSAKFDAQVAEESQRLAGLKNGYQETKNRYETDLGNLKMQLANTEKKLSQARLQRDRLLEAITKQQEALTDG